MNHGTTSTRRLGVIACCLACALCGCSGGAVSVRSNFSGAGGPSSVSGPSTPVPSASAPQGLNARYSGSGNFGLAVLGVLIIADLVQWSSTMLRQAFGADAVIDAQHPDQAKIVSTPKKCVYPVPEMCRPTLIPERQIDADVAAARDVEHVTSSVDVLHRHPVRFEERDVGVGRTSGLLAE